jgi:hypothetical protein
MVSKSSDRIPDLNTKGLNVIVKVKLSLCLTKHHTMKAYWGS